jgi:hypothetical protein
MSNPRTFIDEALESVSSGEDFVQAMADIYSHTAVREILSHYPEWIANIITIIDYDTELQMEGLDFRTYDKEIRALRSIGINSEATELSLLSSESTDEEISQCYEKLSLNNDYDAFWLAVYEYAEENLKNIRDNAE